MNQEPTIEELRNLIEETEFLPQAKEQIGQILEEAKKRGYFQAEEKIKLLEMIDADLFLDKMELEAREKVLSILEGLRKVIEEK